jgi:hypothetical protein
MGGHALGDHHDLAVHHQDAVIVAPVVLLDDHVGAVPRRLLEAGSHRIGVH